MKKGMSKFLSIVLSAAMVSPMVGMNPANAMVSSEDATDSTSKTEPASAAEPANATETTNATKPTSVTICASVIEPIDALGIFDEVRWTEEESLKMLHEFFGYDCDCDQSITDANGKLIIKNCIAVAISKLNNFLKKKSRPILQDLEPLIIKKMVGRKVNTCLRDPQLRFFDSLMDVLNEFAHEYTFGYSEYIINSLTGFWFYMRSMISLTNATLIRSSIPVDLRGTFADKVKSILEIPLDASFQRRALDSWEESCYIESKEWREFNRERGIKL